jgi:hypothetical protein
VNAVQKLIWLVLAGLIALSLTAGPALAVTMNFNFNHGMGPNFTFSQRNTTDVALDDTGGNLRIYSGGMGGSGVRGGEVKTNFTIHGDFDITVDFTILQALADLQQVEIHPLNMSTFFPIRDNTDGGDNYHVWTGSVQGRQPTGDLTGTLRVVRVGTTASAYFWNQASSDYSLIYSGGVTTEDINLGLMVQNNVSQGGSFNVAFDNLTITADRIDGLASSPGFLFLLLDQ